MDTTQVLKALEAELRELDTKKSELARAIETIRRIIVIGSPETASPSRSVMRANMTVEDAAIACLREVGHKMKTADIAARLGKPTNPIFTALTRSAKKADGPVVKSGPGTWALREWKRAA